eukprot:14995008-Heterocapsa_arctica.AAC.1
MVQVRNFGTFLGVVPRGMGGGSDGFRRQLPNFEHPASSFTSIRKGSPGAWDAILQTREPLGSQRGK